MKRNILIVLFLLPLCLLNAKNHVDLNMFGSLSLEMYKVTQEKKYLELGLLMLIYNGNTCSC